MTVVWKSSKPSFKSGSGYRHDFSEDICSAGREVEMRQDLDRGHCVDKAYGRW